MNRKFIFLFIFIFLVGIFSFIYLVGAQVVQTQVIELTEKVRNFFVEATKGNIVGQETINKFGHNEDLGTSFEDVQNEGGILIFLQSAELITFSSNDAGDTLLGTNATSIEIQGLDENFAEITEILNLSGTTGVNTTNEYIRINRIFVHQVGNYSTTNAGFINGVAAISGTTQIQIGAEEGQSQTTHYTVPAGNKVIITGIFASVATGKTVDIRFLTRANADDIIPPTSPIRLMREIHGLNTPYIALSKANLNFNEKTDIWFVAKTTTGATSELEVNYDMVKYAIGT